MNLSGVFLVFPPSLPCEAASLDVVECIIPPSLPRFLSGDSGLSFLQRQSGGGGGALDDLVLHASCPHQVLGTRSENE